MALEWIIAVADIAASHFFSGNVRRSLRAMPSMSLTKSIPQHVDPKRINVNPVWIHQPLQDLLFGSWHLIPSSELGSRH